LLDFVFDLLLVLGAGADAAAGVAAPQVFDPVV
jgi:hypothetical protein